MLSLCMIVKNEEETLEKCLSSAKDVVDEIVIVDTGSIDRTKEIALMFTDKVYDFSWCNDFAKARNFSISKASNDWILILDADEVVESYNLECINQFCNNKNNKAVARLKIVNKYDDGYGVKKYTNRVNRLFNKNYFHYVGSIHEQIVSHDDSIFITENIELVVNHIGYSKEVLNKTNKLQRNIELLKIATEDNNKDPYLHYQLGKSYFMGKDYRNAYSSFKTALTLVDNFYYEYAEDLIESYGYTLINLELFKEALTLIKYEQYYKNSPDFLFLLGLIYMNNGEFKRSAEIFLRCTEFNEGKIEGITSYLPLYNIGVIFECLGFREDASNYYELCGDYKPAIARMNRQV